MSSDAWLIHQAAFSGDVEKVRALIDSDVDVNASEPGCPGSLLTFQPAMIEFLLANGADPSVQKNEFGASVLAGLCYVNQIECVRVLLESGADPNLGRDESLETPLHHALANDASLELIQLLIDHGADVNAKTNPGVFSYNFYGNTPTRGETPLHRAAAYASLEVVKSLLSSGADRVTIDVDGYTAFAWAGWHRRSKELVEMLRLE